MPGATPGTGEGPVPGGSPLEVPNGTHVPGKPGKADIMGACFCCLSFTVFGQLY